MSLFRRSYWRAGAAIIAWWVMAVSQWTVLASIIANRFSPWGQFQVKNQQAFDWWRAFRAAVGQEGYMLFFSILPGVAAVGTYHFLWKRNRTFSIPLETRCRGCGYILRGISEPRCSECGERI